MEIALFKPEIPPNTGNIGRLCWCTASQMHIIDRPAFSLDEAAVRRAGLDYWEKLQLELHADWAAFRAKLAARERPPRILALSRFAKQVYSEVAFRPDDVLLFGSESSGLPEVVRAEAQTAPDMELLRIPVGAECRSLNLSAAATLVLYEGLRQLGFPGLDLAWEDR